MCTYIVFFLLIHRDDSMLDGLDKVVTNTYLLHFNMTEDEDSDPFLSDLQGCLRFSRKYWEPIANENPDMGLAALAQVFVSAWVELPAQAKQEIIAEYEMEVAAATLEAQQKLREAITEGEELMKRL